MTWKVQSQVLLLSCAEILVAVMCSHFSGEVRWSCTVGVTSIGGGSVKRVSVCSYFSHFMCLIQFHDNFKETLRALLGIWYCTVTVLCSAVFHPWVLRNWFITVRRRWAAISPFPSAFRPPDNMQLSLKCHWGRRRVCQLCCFTAVLQDSMCTQSLRQKHRMRCNFVFFSLRITP